MPVIDPEAEPKARILLIYGDAEYSSGADNIKRDLERRNYRVHIDRTRGAYQADAQLQELLQGKRARGIGYKSPDIVITGSRFDPSVAPLFEKAGVPVILLSRRSDEELAKDLAPGTRDDRLIRWKRSPAFTEIVNKDVTGQHGFTHNNHEAVILAIERALNKTKPGPQSNNDPLNTRPKPSRGV